jgi:hypothetical protein
MAYTVLLEVTEGGAAHFEPMPDQPIEQVRSLAVSKADPWTFNRKHNAYMAMAGYVVLQLGYLPDYVIVDRKGNKLVKAYVPVGLIDGRDLRVVVVKAAAGLELDHPTRKQYQERLDQEKRAKGALRNNPRRPAGRMVFV